MKFLILSAALIAVASSQQQNTTPVPILKQLNRHNEDGSYSYGYEGADGSFKIETKYPTGEVFGKYGYVDDSGKLREIEYGASQRGFEPAGNEIQVPPPTLNNNPQAIKPLGPNEEDDGQYREDPSVYYKDDKYSSENRIATPAARQNPTNFGFNFNAQQPQYNQPQPAQYNQPQPQYQPQQYNQRLTQNTYNGFLNSNNNYQQPQQQQQRSYQQPTQYSPVQPRYFNPAHPNFNPYAGHPASNFDVASGSYSVSYRR